MDTIEPFGLELLTEYAQTLAKQGRIVRCGDHRWQLAEGQTLEQIEAALAEVIDQRWG